MLAHPADRRLDRIVVMTMDSAGHFSGRTGPAAGQWDVVIDLARNGERLFRSRNRVILR
jgi:nitrogen fixation protein FixH